MEISNSAIENLIGTSGTRRTAVTSLLNSFEHLPKSKINWDHFFTNSHRFLCSEAAVVDGHKDTTPSVTISRNNNVLSAGINLFHKVITHCITQDNTVLTKNALIMEKILQALTDKSLLKYCVEVYALLIQKVLSSRKARKLLEEPVPDELLRCLETAINKCSGVSKRKFELLKCLQVTVDCCPVLQLRTLLPLIVNLCKSMKHKDDVSYQELVLLICIRYFKRNQDSRNVLCKNGEAIISPLFHLYRPSQNDVKKYLFEFFHYQLVVHHPAGTLMPEPLAFANKRETWASAMGQMKHVILSELKRIKPADMCENYRCNQKHSWDIFCQFAVELFRQFFQSKPNESLDVSTNINDSTVSDEPATKKQRVRSVSLLNFIDDINDIGLGLPLPRLRILTLLLTSYPDTVSSELLKPVLQKLEALNGSLKNPNEKEELTRCLTALLKAQNNCSADIPLDVNLLWDKIWKRLIGLQPQDAANHNLLQALILHEPRNKLINSILQMYATQTIKPTAHTIGTLDCIFRRGLAPAVIENLNGEPVNTKEMIVAWVFNGFEDHFFSAWLEMANFLFALILRTYPTCKVIKETNERVDYYDELIWKYYAVCFENGLMIDAGREEMNDFNNCIVDENLKTNLIEVLTKTDAFNSESSDLFNVIMFLLNIFNLFVKHGVVSKRSKDYDRLLSRVLEHVSKYQEKFQASVNLLNKKKYYGPLIDELEKLQTLFDCEFNEPLSSDLRAKISNELIQELFEMLKVIDVVKDDMDIVFEPSTSQVHIKANETAMNSTATNVQLEKESKFKAFETLCHFMCMSSKTARHINMLQNEIFNALLQINMNFTQMQCFFKCLASCRESFLDNSHFRELFALIPKIYQSQPEDNEFIVQILDLIREFLKHVNLASDEAKKNVMIILKKYILACNSFEPSVSLMALKCIDELRKLDPTFSWAVLALKDGRSPVYMSLASYVRSDYVDVRFATVKILCEMFTTTARNHIGSDKQTMLFDAVCQSLMKLFEVDEKLTVGDFKSDEVANRTMSALHCYASIAYKSPAFRRRVFFAILQLSEHKNLNKVACIDEVFKVLAIELDMKSARNLLHNHMQYLLTHWHFQDYPLEKFPFYLLNLDTATDFFKQYLGIVIPLLIQSDKTETVQPIIDTIGEDVLMKTVFPHVAARVFPILAVGERHRTFGIEEKQICIAKRLHQNFQKYLNSTQMDELLENCYDKVIVQLLEAMHDVEHFQKKFNIETIIAYPHPYSYKMDVIAKTFEYIETRIRKTSLILNLALESPEKLQQMLLKMTLSIHNQILLEEKLLCFHRYCVFVDYICDNMNDAAVENLTTFLIYDICYTLIELTNQNFNTLGTAACSYLWNFFARCLPKHLKLLKELFPKIVYVLIPISESDVDSSNKCLSFLKYLIVDVGKHFSEQIVYLDPFPNIDRFEDLKTKYDELRNKNEATDFCDEIRNFLSTNKIECHIEGLKKLRVILSTNKEQLRNIYMALQKTSVVCEDNTNCILYDLICTLRKLSLSPNKKLSTEATKCLGELGPGNLATFVLPSKIVPLSEIRKDVDAVLLTAGYALAELCSLLVDPDPEVKSAASSATYAILRSVEGRNAIDIENRDTNYGCGKINVAFLYPFISEVKRKSRQKLIIRRDVFTEVANDEELWWPAGTSDEAHSRWISKLVCKLLAVFPEDCFLYHLIDVCEVKASFSENLFPLIIEILMSYKFGGHENGDLLSRRMQSFFEKYWSEASFSLTSVRCMLDAVNLNKTRSSRDHNPDQKSPLNVNYLHVCRAAQSISAHFTTVFYAEQWCRQKADTLQVMAPPKTESNSLSLLEQVCEMESSTKGEMLQQILREAYVKIGDLDAVDGCGRLYLQDIDSRAEHYKYNEDWHKVLLHNNLKMSKRKPNASAQSSSQSMSRIASSENNVFGDVMSSLKQCSLYYIAENLVENNCEMDYECIWRLGKWNVDEYKLEKKTDTFGRYQYSALRSLHDNDKEQLVPSITEARSCVVNLLANASVEASKNLYMPLLYLRLLQELEEFGLVFLEWEKNNREDFKTILEKWNSKDIFENNNFEYIEPIFAQRLCLLNLANDKFEDVNFNEELAKIYLRLTTLARKCGRYDVAKSSIFEGLKIEQLSANKFCQLKLEEAQLEWSNDQNKTVGCYLLQKLLKSEHQNLDSRLKAKMFRVYGSWMLETKSESPEEYFKKSLHILDNMSHIDDDITDDNDNVIQTYTALAKYADSRYEQVRQYMNSQAFETKNKLMKKTKQEALELRIKFTKLRDKMPEAERKAMVTRERESNIDEVEIKSTRKELDEYLLMSMKYYLYSLSHPVSQTFCLYRILTLWLENKTHECLSKLLDEQLPNIPSYKFISILPQLAPHIADNSDMFSERINSLLERCAKDHPHHTLPIILALANSYLDTPDHDIPDKPRVSGAKMIIRKLKRDPNLNLIITQMQQMSEALVEFAYMPAKSDKDRRSEEHKIPARMKIVQIRDFENVCLPTLNLDVRPSGNYENIIGIHSWKPVYVNVGGRNAPKRVWCLGTDGKYRSQLVKGHDDLRQDAVMQQVFSIMNQLLADSNYHNLHIRTYKVVPLSQRSGVLEWCENTFPLSVYLQHAHLDYNPKDLTPKKCWSIMEDVRSKPLNGKLRAYLKICEVFKPAFHHFFWEYFGECPARWWERKQAYTLSVATASMVGYILGLGDRHVNNILIDKSTAEVVHIDFGIAFEQGKILPTPETVPFRLTRDIEDGMGISGVEGVFRRSCEKTMSVLRENSEVILAILNVLLYDPLYVWSLSPSQAIAVQRKRDTNTEEDEDSIGPSPQPDDEVNKTAERALLRLTQKLQGTESGGVISVPSQVERLIQEARNPKNLCQLFVGWQAYY